MIKNLIYRFVLLSSVFTAVILLANESQQGIFSNEKVARKIIIKSALQQVFNQIVDTTQLTIIIKETDANLSRWMKQNLVDSCIAHGYTVYDELNHIPGSFTIVEISGAEISFEYRSAGKKWLFFNKGYKREAKCRFHLSIRKSSGRIVFSKQISNIFNDTVSNIKKLENEQLPFTKGTKSGSSIAKKLIEPVLITASAVTVVYLFYSLRSGN